MLKRQVAKIEPVSCIEKHHAFAPGSRSKVGDLGRVGDRRVVEADARLAVGAALVAEGVKDGGHVARCRAGEVVRALQQVRFRVRG